MAEYTNLLTQDYLQLLSRAELNKEFRDCLRELVNTVIYHNSENIESILLYGGVVRDAKVFEGWSDIDIVVIFKDIAKRSALDLAELIQRLETWYSIRIDLTQVSLEELTDERLARCCFNSEIINALSRRENVSVVVFGHVPNVNFTPEQEKQAAIFYVMNTLGLFRRYLVEVLYRGNIEDHVRADLRRIIRWTFSIVRASLRLFDIYSHPYDYSLNHVEKVFQGLDTSLLKQLIEIRANLNKVDNALEIVQKIETFIEEYVALALRRYYDEIERHR